MSPRWLRNHDGLKVLLAVGAHADRTIDAAVAAIKHAHPGLVNYDSLPYLSADRLLRQAPLESNDAFADRLRYWRDVHRRRGTGLALMEQLRVVFGGGAISETRLQYRNGVEYVLHTDGSITRGESTIRSENGPPEKWARWWLEIEGGELANSSVPLLKLITKEWNAEHTQGIAQIRNNARRWAGARPWKNARKWKSEPPVSWEV